MIEKQDHAHYMAWAAALVVLDSQLLLEFR